MTMKILDSEFLIGFVKDLKEITVIEMILDAGYDIKIPSRVYGELKGIAFKTCKGYIDCGKMVITDGSEQEIIQLKNRYPQLGNGELEVIALGIKLKGENGKYCCILNDKHARRAAKDCGLCHYTTKDLLFHLMDKGVMDKEKVSEIIKKSQNTGYIIN